MRHFGCLRASIHSCCDWVWCYKSPQKRNTSIKQSTPPPLGQFQLSYSRVMKRELVIARMAFSFITLSFKRLLTVAIWMIPTVYPSQCTLQIAELLTGNSKMGQETLWHYIFVMYLYNNLIYIDIPGRKPSHSFEQYFACIYEGPLLQEGFGWPTNLPESVISCIPVLTMYPLLIAFNAKVWPARKGAWPAWPNPSPHSMRDCGSFGAFAFISCDLVLVYSAIQRENPSQCSLSSGVPTIPQRQNHHSPTSQCVWVRFSWSWFDSRPNLDCTWGSECLRWTYWGTNDFQHTETASAPATFNNGSETRYWRTECQKGSDYYSHFSSEASKHIFSDLH